MKTIFEEMGGTYRQVGDYFIPNITITELLKQNNTDAVMNLPRMKPESLMCTIVSRFVKQNTRRTSQSP